MGEDAINHCRSYALEAERKMGVMLAETAETGERETRGGNRNSKYPRSILKLKEIGVTPKESASAQMLNALPESDFQEIKNGKKSKARVQRDANAPIKRYALTFAANKNAANRIVERRFSQSNTLNG